MPRRRVLVLFAVALLLAGCERGGPPTVAQPTPAPQTESTGAAVPEPVRDPASPTDPTPPTPSDSASAPSGPEGLPTTAPTPSLAPSEPFGLAELALVGPGGAVVDVPVYVAAEPATRSRGLMFREALPAGTGMVFLFPDPRRGGFFMKDTLIPLSIAFYGEAGQVLAVLDMEPCGDEDTCPVFDPNVEYLGALEVNQGFFDQIGLDEEWAVELPDDLPDAE